MFLLSNGREKKVLHKCFKIKHYLPWKLFIAFRSYLLHTLTSYVHLSEYDTLWNTVKLTWSKTKLANVTCPSSLTFAFTHFANFSRTFYFLIFFPISHKDQHLHIYFGTSDKLSANATRIPSRSSSLSMVTKHFQVSNWYKNQLFLYQFDIIDQLYILFYVYSFVLFLFNYQFDIFLIFYFIIFIN